jgi:hypothetical protein
MWHTQLQIPGPATDGEGIITFSRKLN